MNSTVYEVKRYWKKTKPHPLPTTVSASVIEMDQFN